MQGSHDSFRFTVYGHPQKLSVPQVAWDQAYHEYKDDPGISGPNLGMVSLIWTNMVREIGGGLITQEAESHYIFHNEGSTFYYEQIEADQRIKALSILSMATAHYNLMVSDILDGRLRLLPSGLVDAAEYDVWLDSVEGALPEWAPKDIRFAKPQETEHSGPAPVEIPAADPQPDDLRQLPTGINVAIAAWRRFWKGREKSDRLPFLQGDIREWMVTEHGLDDSLANFAERLVRPDWATSAFNKTAASKGGKNSQEQRGKLHS